MAVPPSTSHIQSRTVGALGERPCRPPGRRQAQTPGALPKALTPPVRSREMKAALQSFGRPIRRSLVSQVAQNFRSRAVRCRPASGLPPSRLESLRRARLLAGFVCDAPRSFPDFSKASLH